MRGVGLAIAKTASGNAKLGDCATTHAAQASCVVQVDDLGDQLLAGGDA